MAANWTKQLERATRAYYAMHAEISAMVREASDGELESLIRAPMWRTPTNCSWATFEVAPIVAGEAKRERLRRQRRATA